MWGALETAGRGERLDQSAVRTLVPASEGWSLTTTVEASIGRRKSAAMVDREVEPPRYCRAQVDIDDHPVAWDHGELGADRLADRGVAGARIGTRSRRGEPPTTTSSGR